jgi:hypothetical protein
MEVFQNLNSVLKRINSYRIHLITITLTPLDNNYYKVMNDCSLEVAVFAAASDDTAL